MLRRPEALALILALPVVGCADSSTTETGGPTTGGDTEAGPTSGGPNTTGATGGTTGGELPTTTTPDTGASVTEASATTGEPVTTSATATDDTGTDDTDDTGEPPGSFWRIEPPVGDGRTWLVSPTGEKTWMLGVNTVMRTKECDGIIAWMTRFEPTRTARIEWARLATGQSGDEMVEKPYCFNSVGAFSNINEFDDTKGDSYMIRPFEAGGAGAPYSVVVNIGPGGDDRALRDVKGVVLESGVASTRFGDPFNPLFLADIDELAQGQIAERKNDPNLQIWYLGNEIGVFDKGAKTPGVRDYRRYLWSDCAADSNIDAPKCARHALAGFLRERYTDLAALNTAWESNYPGADFSTIVDVGPRPVPYISDCNQQCRVDLQIFVHDRLLRTWVDVITTRVRAADPNHIISAPRMAIGASTHFRFWTPASEPGADVWVEDGTTPVPTDTAEVKYNPLDLLARNGDSGFDLVSFNIYSGDAEFEKPWFTNGVHLIQEMSGLPIIISEFSVRAKIDGWSNKGGAGSFVPSGDAVNDQIQRGAYYQSQIEQFYAFKGIIGANWHAWSDRYLEADAAHQINMGLFRCEVPKSGHTAGERWPEIDERMAATNCDIMKLIEAKTGL